MFFLLRFKVEVAKVLESFVEQEDEFIKKVLQHNYFSFSKHFTLTLMKTEISSKKCSHYCYFDINIATFVLSWLQEADYIRAQEKHRQEVLQSYLEVCFPRM